jgi:hypothetical protein
MKTTVGNLAYSIDCLPENRLEALRVKPCKGYVYEAYDRYSEKSSYAYGYKSTAQKYAQSSKQLKKILFILCILVMITVLFIFFFNAEFSSFTSTMSVEVMNDSGWSFSAKKANGTKTENIFLSSDELNVLYVESTNSSGNLSIVLIQNNIEKAFDISSEFADYIDMNTFESGSIEVKLVFEEVEDVKFIIKWR